MSERTTPPVSPEVESGARRTARWRTDDLVIVTVALLAVGVPAATGGPVLVVRVLLVLAVTAACGTAIWIGLGSGQRRIDALTVLGLGTAIGAALIGFLAIPLRASTPSTVLAVAAAISALGMVVGRAARPAAEGQVASGSSYPRSALPFTVGVALGGVPIALHSVTYPITSAVLRPFHDAIFLQALTDSLIVRGLRELPNAAGVEVQYHWLAYAWLGSLDRVTEAPTLLLLTRVAPVVALVATCALAIDLIRRLPGAVGTGPLAGSLLLFGGAWVGGGVGTGGMSGAASLSTSMGIAWMLALALVALLAVTDPDPAASWFLLPAMGAAVCLGKIQMAIVVAGGLAVMAGVGTLHAAPWAGRARRVVVVTGLGMLAVFVPLQASATQTVSPRPLRVAELLQFMPPSADGGWLAVAGFATLALATSRLGGLLPTWRDLGPAPAFALGAGATGLLFALVFGDGVAAELVALTAAAALVIPLTTTALIHAVADVRDVAAEASLRRTAIVGAALLIAAAGALLLRRAPGHELVVLGPLAGLAGAVTAGSLAPKGRRTTAFTAAMAALSLVTGSVHVAYMAGLTLAGGVPLEPGRIEITTEEMAAGMHVRRRAGTTDLVVHVGDCLGERTPTSDCLGLDTTPILATGLPAIVSTFADNQLRPDRFEERLEYSLSLAAGAPLPTPDQFAGRTLWLWLEPSAASAAAAGTGGIVTFESDDVAIVRVPTAGG